MSNIDEYIESLMDEVERQRTMVPPSSTDFIPTIFRMIDHHFSGSDYASALRPDSGIKDACKDAIDEHIASLKIKKTGAGTLMCKGEHDLILVHNDAGNQYRRRCKDCSYSSNAIPHARLTEQQRQSAIGKSEYDAVFGDTGYWASASDIAPCTDAYFRYAWNKMYYAYLKTEKWRSLRAKVKRRCGNTCEGCMDAAVDEIHHLTYANVGNEFLNELVGYCTMCHKRWHKIGAHS